MNETTTQESTQEEANEVNLSLKQKFINGLLVLVLLLVLLSVVGMLVLDGVAQSIIQKKGSEGLGVKLTLQSAHVGFFGDDSSMKGLAVENPEPFRSDTSPTILTVEEADIQFGVLSLLDGTVTIQNVTASGVSLTLQEKDGKTNIDAIINHIKHDETPEGSHPEPKFNIETLTIKNIKVHASGSFTIFPDKVVDAHIDEITLHNIGTDGDAEVATEAITSAVTHAIMQHLSEHPVEGFSRLAFSNVTNAINSLPIFHQLGIGTAVQDVTDSIGRGVDGILNIFDDHHDKTKE
ncbi:MAG: hypothetical protein CMJ38_00980 [Phycisphaerae bacterium]|nr:hypothetical protein [Phycisphaerae bacterium]